MYDSLRNTVLSIAGFDPSGGAGVLADVKTLEANGVYGMGVVTALTFQNDTEFERVEWVKVDDIIEQISVLLRRFEIRFIKIGLIENADTLRSVIRFLKDRIENPLIVFDPIVQASAGFTFHERPELFTEILKDIYCITPNIPEAEWLFGKEQLHEALEAESEFVNIYLKGGHSDRDTVTDMLFVADHTYVFPNDRITNGAKHGSGCVLSAALIAGLAKGAPLADAAEAANTYTQKFLASSTTLLGHHHPI